MEISNYEFLQHSIPLAHLICFVPLNSIKTKSFSRLKEFGVEIITNPNSKEIIANRRFIKSYIYLSRKNFYERVLLIDLKDIFIFDDIFGTIGKYDFFVNYICNNESKKLETIL